jgi:hypothetical protein
LLRTLILLLCTATLSSVLAACSASQAGCVQPALQNYAVPQLVYPQSGTKLSPSGLQDAFVAYPPPIAGAFQLFGNGATVGLPTNPPRDPLPPGSAQPHAGWKMSELFLGTLTSGQQYVVQYAIPYKLACEAGDTSKVIVVGSFST